MMASAKRLTDLMIGRYRSQPEGRTVLWDLGEAGLGIRIGAIRRTFILKMRHRDRQKMLTLGHFPNMSIAQAREAAREIKLRSARGVNPTGKKIEPEAADLPQAHDPLVKLVETYVEQYAKPNQRSWKDTAACLRNHLAAELRDRPIASITRTDILRIVDLMRSKGMAQGSNRVLAHTKRFFDWCVAQGAIEQSPAAGVRPPIKEKPRDRVLTNEEICRVWQAGFEIGFPFGHATQLLLLTGQRRDEVSRMSWSELDLAEAVWTIPAERNKSGRPHQVPLSTLAQRILAGLPKSEGFVFWGRTPDIAINGWSRAKLNIDAASCVFGWRLHDLRRTAATGMARLGFDPHIVERVLNHATSSSGPLARVYQRYAYEEEKRQALEAWATSIEKLVAN